MQKTLPRLSNGFALMGGLWLALASPNLHASDVTKPADAEVKAASSADESSEVAMNAAEKAFAERMKGAALVGQFTIDGRDVPARPERYEIDSVRKISAENDWIVTARIKYGDYDVKVPVALKILWAGDTPVMSLTDLTIPLMGTFTARVMFHGDRYVGTWQHGKVGGHMFGKVEAAQLDTPESRDGKNG